MAIDVHAHYFPSDYLERIGKSSSLPPSAVLGSKSVDERIDLLDRCGIGAQVLSIGHAQPYLPSPGDSRDAVQLVNDSFVALCDRYPRRFYTFAALPLPHVDATLNEISRTDDVGSVVGFTIGCSVAGLQLDDQALIPVFEELNRRSAVVLLHPVAYDAGAWLAGANLTWLVGAPFEDTVAALRLALSEVPRRYPQLQIIVPHLGGTVPFLLSRVSRITRRPGLVADLRTLYYDTVSGSREALVCACGTIGSDRLIFGTDYPYCDEGEFEQHLSYLSDTGLEEQEVKLIAGDRAAMLLGIQS